VSPQPVAEEGADRGVAETEVAFQLLDRLFRSAATQTVMRFDLGS